MSVYQSLGGLLGTIMIEIAGSSSRIQEVSVGICISNMFLLQEHALSITVWEGLIQLVWRMGLVPYVSQLHGILMYN